MGTCRPRLSGKAPQNLTDPGNTHLIDPQQVAAYADDMDYTQHITIEPGKRSGQPCIRGMRITVRDVLEYLAGGMSVPELLKEFPELTTDDVRGCLSWSN